MTALTRRNLSRFFSFLVSLVVTWVTGATSFARESNTDVHSGEGYSLEEARQRLRIASSSRVQPDASLQALGITGELVNADTGRIVVAAYESDSPTTRLPGNDPVPPVTYVPTQGGELTPTEENERQTLERLLNTRVRIEQQAAGCVGAASSADVFRCFGDVIEELGKSLEYEAGRGSHVARAALPVINQMASEVRAATTEAEAVAAVRRGLGKVERIRAVRSQEIVIANRQRQQRAVVTDTLQSVEVSLVKAMSI